MRSSGWEVALLRAIKIGLWGLPILPLYISTSLLFPFITGKNFLFRIVVEVLFALWAGLAVARPEFRPRLTPLFKAATVFIAVLFLADLLSPNPHRAFFSNYERMEGFMMLSHLYLYFVVLSSVFKTRKDWLIFFHVTLATSVVVGFIGVLQKLGLRVSLQGGYRIDSTIGNPTYLAAYLLFHIWLLVMLLYEFIKKWWLAALYSSVLIFELTILYFTATRGAVLALLGTFILFGISVVWFYPKIFPRTGQNQKDPSRSRIAFWGRRAALAILGLVIVLPVIFWLIRNADFINSNQVLNRLTNYSLEETTVKSRFMIWKMSWQGFLERPILGWGQENYYLVFQKYFNPGLYAQEPWFDRSHNVILDWLVHAGFLGLFSYLSIIAAAVYMIIYAMRRALFDYWQGLVLMALLVAHFFQNLFVFDNLNTYLLFFAFLAYIQTATGGAVISYPPPNAENPAFIKNRRAKAAAVGVSALILVAVGGYFLHLKPIKEAKILIGALGLHQQRDSLAKIEGVFRKALSYHAFGDTEVREQMANIAREIVNESRFPEEERRQFIKFTTEELAKEIAIPAKDVKHMIFLASVLDRAAVFNPAYLNEAENLLKEAIKISPGKQMLYFELAQVYITGNRLNEAAEVLKKTVELESSNKQAVINLMIVGFLAKRLDVIEETKKYVKVEALNRTELERIGEIYMQINDFVSALPVFEALIELGPEDARYRAALASIYAQVGRVEDAVREAKEAARLDPKFAQDVEAFLKQLENLR